ncbi:hypothetical protein [uncultured Winogradskyella sp.]|uniref:hypothetical protein n=1 Tax=uncultured Winogradskyella sp. TaxID=395353 RepID=UPI002621171B|nr:hypothetical protein [uncultured Winogradskyella sp.]
MGDKINTAIEYYLIKQKEILELVNNSFSLSIEDIIRCGEELSVLESKITALEVAKEN